MLKVGDLVIVHKPENVYEAPTWVPKMDKFDGMEMRIKGISYGGYFLDDTFYKFNRKWLEFVDDCEDLSCESFEDLL